MKKNILLIILSIVVVIGYLSYILFAPAFNFDEKSKSFIIEEGNTNKEQVINSLEQSNIIKNVWALGLLADQFGVWKKLKPGKYEVKRKDNLINIVRMLKNNRQVEVKLVITKIRTHEDLAHLIGKNFSTDSTTVMQFISNNDSLKPYSVDTNSLTSLFIPNTYSFYWGTPLSKIFSKLQSSNELFWDRDNRTEKAKRLGFSPKEIYTIASIVEEETNKEDDKGKIASVYMNRYHKGMNLGADPTIKFALKDFSLKRIYFKHLSYSSPYNTYKNKGLPPGPICTPSINTIDAVLDAPQTTYLYFVAKPDFSGYSNFSSTFSEHSAFAKQYQQALDAYLLKNK